MLHGMLMEEHEAGESLARRDGTQNMKRELREIVTFGRKCARAG